MAKGSFIFISSLCFVVTVKAQSDSTTHVQTDSILNLNSARRWDSIVQKPQTVPDAPATVRNINNKIYKLKPAIDIPVIAAGSAWTLYAFSKIYDRDPSTVAKINSLNVNNIPRF